MQGKPLTERVVFLGLRPVLPVLAKPPNVFPTSEVLIELAMVREQDPAKFAEQGLIFRFLAAGRGNRPLVFLVITFFR